MVEALDNSVGRLVAKLDEPGIADNTVIILTEDNGGNDDTTTAGLKGFKGFSHEGGVLEAAGLPARPDQHRDGVSFLSLLNGKNELKRDTLYGHDPHYHRTMPYGAIREKNWKLIEFYEEGDLELYDLANDPQEKTTSPQRIRRRRRSYLPNSKPGKNPSPPKP